MSDGGQKSVVFRAKPSLPGIVSGTVLVGGLLILGLVIQKVPGLHWLAGLIIYAFLLVAVFFLIIYFTIAYEFSRTDLRLKAGPFHWSLPVGSIKSVVRTDLKYHPTSTGWKLPGYALFTVYYADRGNVRMCATHACKGILLLSTDSALYGITPHDEEGFIRELHLRMR